MGWAFSPAGDGLVACGENLWGAFELIGGAQAQVILLAAFTVPLVGQVLLFAGIVDLALDFRKLRPRPGAV